MHREHHPFAQIMVKLLGLSTSNQVSLCEGVLEYYLHQRNLFLDKVESGNQIVSLQQVVDFTKDYYEQVRLHHLWLMFALE